jgi:hypothetical protein
MEKGQEEGIELMNSCKPCRRLYFQHEDSPNCCIGSPAGAVGLWVLVRVCRWARARMRAAWRTGLRSYSPTVAVNGSAL